MDVRTLDEREVPAFVDDLYLPFAREMATLDEYNRLADETAVRESNVAYRRDQLASDRTRIWVAEREGGLDGEDGDGQCCGYVCASVKTSPPIFARGPTLSVSELYVVEEARGEGVADALLDRAEAWGRERDCERVGLSVNARNDRARAFYESRGFETRRLKLDRPL